MRVYNFNPGPSTLPIEVLEKAKEELLDYKNTGLSVMEMSHRSPEFSEIISKAKDNIKKLFSIGENHEILFLQGGASQQFFMFPMNFLSSDKEADYIDTGAWSSKAIKEAKLFGKINVVYSGKEENYKKIPQWDEFNLNENALYCHITTNNTIYGTQYQSLKHPKGVLLVADMSSDIMTRKINIEDYAMIYAGAQKNLGPSGVTLVIINKEFVEKHAKSDLPTILKYKTHIEKGSLFNTPPTFGIYMISLVTDWALSKGGIEVLEKECEEKAKLVYEVIDNSDIYKATADKSCRSKTNITFRLPDEEMEKRFIEKAKERGMIGLKGHRSVGGIRVSNYSAMTIEGIKTLTDFMREFEKTAV